MHKECLKGDRIFVIHDFPTVDDCRSFIARSEETGYEAAGITTPSGPVIDTETRNNARLIADDPVLPGMFWHRARPFLPPTITGWYAIGLNERFRYYRYDPGQKFALHYDGFFQRGDGEQSHLTFMAYLNGTSQAARRSSIAITGRRTSRSGRGAGWRWCLRTGRCTRVCRCWTVASTY